MQFDCVTPADKKALIEARLDADVEAMRGKTPQQIVDYLTANLGTLGGQAQVITRLTKIVYYLLHRMEENDA